MINYFSNGEMKKNKTRIAALVGIVFIIILCALLFAALDIEVESQNAQAAYTTGQSATMTSWGSASTSSYTISLGSKNLKDGSSRVDYNSTLTFSGKAGALYRNGAIKLSYNCNFNTTYHDDYGGMSMSGPNFTAVSHGKKTGDWNRTLTATPSAKTGTTTTYVVRHNVWADDDKFTFVNYNTDTDVTCANTVSKSATDSSGPTVTITYPDGDQNTWKSSKYINITLKDNLAGVDPSTIKINNIALPSNARTESGRTVTITDYLLSKPGNNNLVIDVKDYFGNSISTTNKTHTVSRIDNTPPYVTDIVLYTKDRAGNYTSITTNTWVNTGIVLQAAALDEESGLNIFQLGPKTKIYSAGTTTIQLLEVVVSSNGTYSGLAVNNVSPVLRANINPVTITRIDNTKPILQTWCTENWTNGDVTIYIKAYENGTVGSTGVSGVNRVEVKKGNTPKSVVASNGVVATPNGSFSFTHRCTVSKNDGKVEYAITAFDNAGNSSDVEYVTPKIDTLAPTIVSIALSGKKADGTTINNAGTNYSYTDVTVTVNITDNNTANSLQGISGVKQIWIFEGTSGVNPIAGEVVTGRSVWTFNGITKNTILLGTYKVLLQDHAGNIVEQYFYPKKDSEQPLAEAIGMHNWQSTSSGQNIDAKIWFGLSGGTVYMRRTYLGGADGKTIVTEEKRIIDYPVGTNMYSGTNKIHQNIPSQTIRNEGEEYYHFKVVSNAGKESYWMGIDSLPSNTASITSNSNNWVFSSNGARTRIDTTAPTVTVEKYDNGVTTVAKDLFSNSNYIAEAIYGRYIINDGFEFNGIKTSGINSSGLNASQSMSVTYTVTEGLTASAVTLNTAAAVRYSGSWSTAKFFVLFSNQGLVYDGTIRVPIYTIRVKDIAGNVTEFSEQPYIDNQPPNLEVSAVEIINESTTAAYNFKQEHSWTSNDILFTINKTFGQSGATVAWCIDNNKTSSPPDAMDEAWQTATSSTWGTISDSPMGNSATIRIPTYNSFDANIYFIIRSNAKNLAGRPITAEYIYLESGAPKYPYIAIDNSKPNIINYEFQDTSNNVITQTNWSSTDVYLFVNVSDVPENNEYTDEGSGVKEVTVTIRNSTPLVTVPMQMVDGDPNRWRSVTTLGSNQYNINIEDNVGHFCDKSGTNQSRYITYRPNIDKVSPQISVTGGAYDSLKGSRTVEATPTNSSVQFTITGSSMESGATLYYKERSKSSFNSLAYNVDNINLAEWTTLETISLRTSIYKAMTIGSANAEFYNGYDFIAVSGAGKKHHIEYGTVFIDRKSPELVIEDIIYIRDDGQTATGIIPKDGIAEWTNASVTAKLYIKDGDNGSGINPSSVTLNGQEWISTEELSPISNNGYYIFLLNDYINYNLVFEDNASNQNTFTIKPLIDRQEVSISLNAKDRSGSLYNINPNEPGGVKYIDKDVIVTIDIQYGLSSFAYDASTFAKGQEKYNLEYTFKLQNGTEVTYDITQKIGYGTSWINPEDGTLFEFIPHQNNASARYRMTLTQNQNRSYSFKVTNGIKPENASENGPATSAVPPMQSGQSPVLPTIKIDKTAPELRNITYSDAEGNTLFIDQWTYKDIKVTFEIIDNQYGSGVLEDGVKSVVVIRRLVNAQQTLPNPYIPVPVVKVDGKYSFTMDSYYNYYIEYEDIAGNGISHPIRPLIDKERPEFMSQITAKINVQNGEDYITAIGEHPWTYQEVKLTFNTSVSISGQKLQYSVRSINRSTDPWGAWTDVTGINQENGVVAPFPYEDIIRDGKTTIMLRNQNSHTYEYRFRVISGAGLVSQTEVDNETLDYNYFGDIRIDTITPTININAFSKGSAYSSDTWTDSDVTFNINVLTRGNSGTKVEVTNDPSLYWTTLHGTLGEVLNSASANPSLVRKANTTWQGEHYYFRITSVAGLETQHDFGFVKIDKGNALNITVDSKQISEEDVLYKLGSEVDYANTYNAGTTHRLNEWSSNYIILKINVQVGPSGGFVQYCDDNSDIYKDTDLDKNIIVVRNNDDLLNTHAVYILIKENQNKNYKFKVTSNSGVTKILNLQDSIKIDRTKPYMELTIDDGTKTVQWQDDSNIYDIHRWYTSVPEITFNVGRYGSKGLETLYPVSGATVYYRESWIDGNGNRVYKSVENEYGQTIEWFSDSINNNGYNTQGNKPKMKILHNASLVKTYEFKIVTGAGLEFILTQQYNNPDNIGELWVKGLESDELPGMYTIQVDTTEYVIDIEQWIEAYGDLPAVNHNYMANLTVYVNEADSSDATNPIPKTSFIAKRGDYVSVAIEGKAYNDTDGGYHLKRVQYTDVTINSNNNGYLVNSHTLNGAQGEALEFNVYNTNYTIKSYFTKEIKINYDNPKQYLQANSVVNTVNTITNPDITTEHASGIGLSFALTYDNNSDVPQNVGKYSIQVTIDNDDTENPNYIIHVHDQQYLIVEYFNNVGQLSTPIYNIYNSIDLDYIGIYNDPNDYAFLGQYRLSATYNQQNDIQISNQYQPVHGIFTGTYNGNDKEIVCNDTISAEGVFGLFESVSGEVKNLGVRIKLVIVDNATNVGFVAGELYNGKITNSYAIGEMYFSGTDANIGGLVGYVYGEQAGQGNDTIIMNVYTDIAMSNKGNTFSGNIGGVIGYMENSGMLNAHGIGAMEVYGINQDYINAGALAGSIQSIAKDGFDNDLFQGNKYILSNLFINENIISNNGIGDLGSTVSVSGTSKLEGLYFNSFVSELSSVSFNKIASQTFGDTTKNVGSLAIQRIRLLGMSSGIGTIDDPFYVESKEHLEFIDKYVWGHYIQTALIDLGGGEFDTIAAHKVFIGVYNGNNNTIQNIFINSTDKNAGIFGKVSGTIKNVDIRNLEMTMDYNGTETAYAGGIAAILAPGANLELVYVLGNILASAPNTKLYLGGITGYAQGAVLKDILSMANVKTLQALSLDIGGTAGYVEDSNVSKIYSLARVEGNYVSTGTVGALIGTIAEIDGITNEIRDAYALLGNTYAHSDSYDNLVGKTVSGASIQGSLISFDTMRNSGYRFEINSVNLTDVLTEVYPFAGLGTENNPFQIYNVQQFNSINNFLYANYKIRNNIDFAGIQFKTIGVGAKFTGSITAAMTNQEYIDNGNEGPRSYKLLNMTDSLVHYNDGKIMDIRLHIEYNKVHYNDVTFGTVAVYNRGIIQNVITEGNINLRVNGNGLAIVGGFVGEDLGGNIIAEYNVQAPSSELSSINSVSMIIIASQVNAGGFVGRITGPTKLSYLISEGDVACIGGSILAGTIAGAVLDNGMVLDNEIEATATVTANWVIMTQKYGFYINP